MLINTTSDLNDICGELIEKKPKFIAVDTEFIRDNIHYYPNLSLIQISYGEKSFIADALATAINLSPIKEIMLNKEIIKVFHSCKQDIESLFTVFQAIPVPIFDTQIAAMFCNYYHDFIGYSKLIEEYKGVTLDKIKAKNSNWLNRPLSDDQLDYAINDVTHLYDLYQILSKKLEKNNRISWFQEEMHSISDMNKYLHSPKEAWKRIKFNYEINPRLILTVKAVSEWQETLAQRYNKNRNKIINNSVISDLIEKNVEHVDEILDDLKVNAQDMNEEDLLEFINIFNENEKNLVQETLGSYDKSVFGMLSIILDNKCKESNISRKLVCSKDELIRSISGRMDKLFSGWRYDFFGKSIESFLSTKSKFEITAIKFAGNITKIQSSLVDNES